MWAFGDMRLPSLANFMHFGQLSELASRGPPGAALPSCGTPRVCVDRLGSRGPRWAAARVTHRHSQQLQPEYSHAAHTAHASVSRRKVTVSLLTGDSRRARRVRRPSMQFVIPGCKIDPPKRVSAKMIHLTYAALYDGELTFDSLLHAAR